MQSTVKEDREKYIGGSDIPIIMGISHFKTRFDLLLEKAGLKEIEETDNEYTRYGNEIEPIIRNYINETYKTNYVEGKHIDGDIRCHTDGEEEDSILEIKSTSQVHETLEEYKYYLAQLLFYMEHTDKSKGKLVVYKRNEDFSLDFDPNRLQIFDVDINDYKDLIENINTAVNLFRYDLTRLKANPLLSENDLMPESIIALSNTIMSLEEQIKAINIIQKKQEELKEMLRKEMNEVCIKRWEMPNGTVITNVLDGEDKVVNKFNEAKFKEENPKLYNKYCEEKEIKGRKGYLKISEK